MAAREAEAVPREGPQRPDVNLRALPRRFYARDPVEVAQDLLGRLLIREESGVRMIGRIVEVEAYSHDDPASHSFKGQTRRNVTMFGPPGYAYVYVSHGIHHCMNVTTGGANAVLLRALEPQEGDQEMARRRGLADHRLLCGGPGRLCQALGITLADDGHDITQRGGMWIAAGEKVASILATARIGLTAAAEVPWRFVEEGSRYASRPASVSRSTG
jgi:DNA-3-methyladenine glycosylase